MAAPAHTSPDALDPSAPADPIAFAAFVSRRGGRVVAYLDAVTTPERALYAAGEAFATFRQARAADPDGEASATALLRAVRRAATANAENPYRPEGRERPAERTRACEAMPRLLVAWTEARLPEGDVGRLIEHLQDCPDCRAMRDAFDRAEIGYRGGEAVELDGTEVGVIATAMALSSPADPVARPDRAAAPAPAPAARARRTAIPAPPSSVADHLARPSSAAPVGRRTSIPAPPTAVPLPPAAGTGDATVGAGEPADGAGPGRPTDGAGPARKPADSARTRLPKSPSRRTQTAASGTPDAPEDPLGPEALGYAVPARGLPRPARRAPVPRVRPRRRRRPPSEAVAASVAVDPTEVDAPAVAAAEIVVPEAGMPSVDVPAVDVPKADLTSVDVPTDDVPKADVADAGPIDDHRPADRPVPPASADAAEDDHALPAALPATVAPSSGRDARPGGRVAVAGRRALQVPIVRQLGVPAVLLLAVLIAALIAAGAFAGQDGDSVEPVTRPTIPTVPSNPGEIPPLR